MLQQQNFSFCNIWNHDRAGTDPGFPVEGHGPILGECGPLTVYFVKNACENERIGLHGGGGMHQKILHVYLPMQSFTL